MLIEDISSYQVITAILFIAALIAVQVFISKNKNKLKVKWGPLKRIQLIDYTRLGPTEKVQIIKVDDDEYLYFFCKGSQPVIIPIASKNKTLSRKRTDAGPKFISGDQAKSHHGADKLKAKVVSENPVKPDSKIIQAISIARKQNPKVSFE